MNISSTAPQRFQPSRSVAKAIQPAEDSKLQNVDSFVSDQTRDGEAGIAALFLGVIAVPTVVGAIGGGTIAAKAFNAGFLGTAAGAIGGGLLAGGAVVAYFAGGE